MATAEVGSDVALWQLVCGDDRHAFAELVGRHQSAVAAVAYSACGDLTLSEDIAQETFWAAWRERATLLDPTRLRAWLCGIARNMANNAMRRTRPSESLDRQSEQSGGELEPLDEAASREEQALVWQALEEIPETYREPLILFHREHQSVAEVAMTLELSSDTVKQRLSRGREILREQVADLVERTLKSSRPRAAFTTAVIAGLTAMSAGTKSAIAGTASLHGSSAAVLSSGVAAVGKVGLLSPLFGTLAGLAGSWFGMWLPAQLAPTNRERQHLSRVGRRMLIVSIIATVLLLGIIWLCISTRANGIQLATATIGWMVLFQAYVGTESYLAYRAVRRIRAETPTDSDRNTARLAVAAQRVVNRWEGRVYRSSATFLGLPLIDIRVSDPGASSSGSVTHGRLRACGWIAIGDRADGILLAIGGKARGLIAIGGMAIGGVSCGGIAIGLCSFGGVAVGALVLGGLAIGGLAFGGGAIGWQACGGGALGWDLAGGGGAIAYHAAFGGAAIAHDIALGGGALALHANDDVAKAFFEGHWLVDSLTWLQAHNTSFVITTILVSLLPSLITPSLMYRRKPAGTSC